MNPNISVIILNWNGKEYIEDCLRSVLSQAYDNFNVILVDNNSTDGSVEFIRKNFSNTKIIALDQNYGFAKGNNIGIKYALEKYNPEYILLLNNDTKIVREDTLTNLTKAAESDCKIGILGCKLISSDGKTEFPGTNVRPLSIEDSSGLLDNDFAIAAAFLIKKSVINTIGLFDEGYSPFLIEDVDYCIRAKKAGYLIKVFPSIEVIHNKHSSLQKQPLKYVDFVEKKNIIRFCLLNLPFPMNIFRIFYEGGLVFKYLPYNTVERKNKRFGIAFWNLRIRRNRINRLANFFRACFANLINLKEILYRRTHRTEKLWF